MLTRLDYLVILVRDLDRAVRDCDGLGFTVTPGGEHADGLTRNALIPFKDSSYLEHVAFLDPDDPWDNVWGWRAILPSGGGLIDYSMASDDSKPPCVVYGNAVSTCTAPPPAGDGSRTGRIFNGG